MTASQDLENYTVALAYRLGDQYKRRMMMDIDHQIQWYFAAKGCYTLPAIEGHQDNKQQYIKREKLTELEQLKQQYNIIIATNTNTIIPLRLLCLLKAFYAPWLVEIKEQLKDRCIMHMTVRETCLMDVYQQVTGDRLDVTAIKGVYVQQHCDYIDQWEGPEFQKLTLRTKEKVITDCLSVVYDYKGYYKRCNNSQEEWSKKYDGCFLARCIKEIGPLFGTMIALKVEFGWKLLEKKVKFPKSKETYLIPNSWLFCSSDSSLLIALTDLLNVDKTPFKGSTHKKQKRQQLMNLFQRQCDIQSQQNMNEEVEMKGNSNMDHDDLTLQIPPNSLLAPTPCLSASHTSSSYASSTYTSSASLLSNQYGSIMPVDNGWPNMQSQTVNVDNNALHHDDYDHIEEFEEIENDTNVSTNMSSVPQSSAPLFIHRSQQHMNGNQMYTSSPMIDAQQNQTKIKQLEEENEILKRELSAVQQMLYQQQSQNTSNGCNNANNGISHQIQQIQANNVGYAHQEMVNYGGSNHNINNGNISSNNGQHQYMNNNPDIVANNNYNVCYAHQQMVNNDGGNHDINHGNIPSNNRQYQQHININNPNIVINTNYNHQTQQNHSIHISYSQEPTVNYGVNNHNINHGNIASDNGQHQQYLNDNTHIITDNNYNQRINHQIEYESMNPSQNGLSFQMLNHNNSHHIQFNGDDDSEVQYN